MVADDDRSRLDDICSRFESDWSASAGPPDLGHYLAEADEAQRCHLFSRLIAIDLGNRQKRSLDCDEAHYRSLFPQHSDAIEAIFAYDQTVTMIAADPGEDDTLDETLDPLSATLSESEADANSTLVTNETRSRSEEPENESRRDRVGDYVLLNKIAHGGMGVVYRALQISLNRTVALKMMLTGEFANEREIQRFQSEAEAAAKLDHPGIVPIFEIGEHGGKHYFSMGYVEGPSLAKRLRDGPLPPREAAEMLAKICDAVAYAHDRGVIHRDLKPGNVLIDAQGTPKVTDFGLAKQVDADSELTQAGQVIGTPSFMPPEQASGDLGAIGPCSDVYSLGAVLYSVLTGRPPFQAATNVDTVLQVIHQEPVPPRSLNTQVPKDLDTICLKCLRKDSASRYASASDLAADLRRYLAGEPIRARPITRLERTVRWAKRRPADAALVAVSLVALIAVGGVSLWYNRRLQSKNEQLVQQTILANQQAEHAADQSELALDTLGKVIDEIQFELAGVPKAQLVRRRLLNTSIDGLKSVSTSLRTAPEKSRHLIQAHLQLGQVFLITDLVGDQLAFNAAMEEFELAKTIANQAIEDNPKDLLARANLARVYESMGEAFKTKNVVESRIHYEKALEIATEVRDSPVVGYQTPALRAHNVALIQAKLGLVCVGLADTEVAESFYLAAHDTEVALQGEFPDQEKYKVGLAFTSNQLGKLRIDQGRPQAAEDYWLVELEMSQQLAKLNPLNALVQADLARVYRMLAQARWRQNDAAKAGDYLKMAESILTELEADDPNSVIAQRSRAMATRELAEWELESGQVDQAFRRLKPAVATMERLLTPDLSRAAQSDAAGLLITMAKCLERRGAMDEARAMYQRVIEVRKRIVGADANDVQQQRMLASSYESLGDLEARLLKLPDAMVSFEACLEIRLRIVDRHPDLPIAHRELSVAHNKFVMPNLMRGQPGQAREAAKKGLTIAQDLYESQPGDVKAARDLATSFEYLGNIAFAVRNFPDALLYYEQCVEIRQAAADGAPDDLRTQRELATVFFNLSMVNLKLDNLEEGKQSLKESLRVWRHLAEEDETDLMSRGKLADGTRQLGNLYAAGDDHEQAIDHYREALALAKEVMDGGDGDSESQVRFVTLSLSKARAHSILNQTDDAVRLLQDAKEIAERLNQEASDLGRKLLLSDALFELGTIAKSSDTATRREWLERCLELRKQALAAAPNNFRFQEIVDQCQNVIESLDQE